MTLRTTLLLFLLPACAAMPAAPAAPAAPDTIPSADVETAPPSGCDGTLVFDLSLGPETFRPGLVASWQDQEARVETRATDQGLEVAREEGCLRLTPAELFVDLTTTRCGARRARARVLDTCSPSCTELRLAAGDEPVASNRNTRTEAEEELALAPTRPFNHVFVKSVDARLCALEVDLSPLPDELTPPDTGAPF